MPPATQPDASPETLPAVAGIGHLIRRVEAAHGKEAWTRHAALQCDLTVTVGGETIIDGTLQLDLRKGRSRIDLEDGVSLVFDGERAWVTPADAETSMARFHLRTWPYFIAVPFKLRDPGVRATRGVLRPLLGRLCETIRLEFAAGTGDTPDDWYVLHVDPASDRIAALAYIVTYGTAVADAADDPHAIVYERFQTVAGVTLATDWTFRSWNDEEGLKGDPLGSARLRGVRFLEVDEDRFSKPPGAREDDLPAINRR